MYDADVGKAKLAPKIAQGRFSALPRPFLRWAGSKQALVQYILPILPKNYNRYYEPFLGSGALFFSLKPKRATLSDASTELVSTWEAVRRDVDAIANFLSPLRPDKEFYYKIRSRRSEDALTRAAEFLYLNKTCWNGLYRVNSRGEFNVPYGSPRTNFIFDEDNLRACSKLLSRATISLRNCDFAGALRSVRKGDLVYLDPPYVTTHNNNGFRDWNEKLFRWDDQKRLAEIAHRLRRRGASIVVSNANHRDILALYEGFEQVVIERASTLSSSAAFRGRTTEVILYSIVEP